MPDTFSRLIVLCFPRMEGNVEAAAAAFTHRKGRSRQFILEKSGKHLPALPRPSTADELEKLAGGISHDLRASLRAMHGFAQLLLENCGEKLGLEGQDYLRRIGASAQRAGRLAQDILALSQIGRARLRLEPVDVQILLWHLLETGPVFEAPRVEVQLQSSLPVVRGDKSVLHFCIVRLLDRLAELVARDTVLRVRVWSEQNGASVRLWFAGDSIDVPGKTQERISGVLQDAVRTSEGPELGLAIVREAARQMGGKLGAAFDAGHNSGFWLELQSQRAVTGDG
jgi:signal transduction histidine kinase